MSNLEMGKSAFLATAVLALRETLLAIDRAIFPGLEGNLALFFTIRADRLVHLPRPTEPTTTLLKRHTASFFRSIV